MESGIKFFEKLWVKVLNKLITGPLKTILSSLPKHP